MEGHTVRARWAIGTYDRYQRKEGSICDVVYYDENGQEVAFFVLILQADGSFMPQSNMVHHSQLRSDDSFLAQHRTLVEETIMALVNLIIKGIYSPQVVSTI